MTTPEDWQDAADHRAKEFNQKGTTTVTVTRKIHHRLTVFNTNENHLEAFANAILMLALTDKRLVRQANALASHIGNDGARSLSERGM